MTAPGMMYGTMESVSTRLVDFAKVAAPNDQIGDQNGDYNDNGQCHDADDDRVADGAHQHLLSALLIIDQRITRSKNGVVVIAEGHIHNVDLREHCDGNQQIAVNMHQHAANAMRLFSGRSGAGR